jgi:cytidylate kinase
VTLDEALERAGRRFDEAAASNAAGVEDLLRQHAASDEEIDIEMARVRAQHAADRRLMLATVIAIFYSWHTEPVLWEAPGSAQVH